MRRLDEWGVKEPMHASLSVALPILQGAADEDREELVDLFARLLANAMNPKLNNVRQSFIDAVNNMDPPDAKIMHHMFSEKVTRIRRGGGGESGRDTSVALISKQLDNRYDDTEVSIEHLEGLGFLTTAPTDKNIWFLSAKLREFMRACYPEQEQYS